MLTRKQRELLLFIHERLKESGVPPSFDEMKEALDLRSKSGIHRLITALEERGFIRRLPHRARALEILKLPEAMSPAMPPASRGFSPNVVEGRSGQAPAARGARRAGLCFNPRHGPYRRGHAHRGDPEPFAHDLGTRGHAVIG